MKRAISNAFTRSSHGFRNPCRSLAASLASMQVLIEKTDGRFDLKLSPMSTFDAVGAWTLIDAPDHEHRCLTIILDASVADEFGTGAESVAAVAARWGIGLVPIGENAMLASDNSLRQLMTLSTISSVTLLRVVAPIETDAACSLVQAVRAGAAPLEQPEVIAAMSVGGDHIVNLEARGLDQALRLVSENFRHYLAAICNEAPANFAAVPIAVLRPWLSDGGVMTVRPIETEVYSTFVDIGVCPSILTARGPATLSLVYDRPSATWHGED